MARDFIEDDPELRELMRGYPPPRKCSHNLYPVFIGIPRTEMVDCVPRKYYGFRGGHHSKFGDRAYAFGPHEESEYKRAYRESYFGSTKKKAGWDCMRHYEIVASGAVPFFDEDPTRAPSATLAFWPKKLLLRDLRTWPGVFQNGTVDVDVLDASGAYSKLAAGLLTYLRERLTTEALARYILETMGQAQARNVLILSAHPAPTSSASPWSTGSGSGSAWKRSTLSSPFTYTSRASRRPSTRRRGPNCMATASPTPIGCATTRASTGPILGRSSATTFSTLWCTRRCIAVYRTLTSCGSIMDTTRSPSSTARTSTAGRTSRWGCRRSAATSCAELPDGCPPDVEVGGGVLSRRVSCCVFFDLRLEKPVLFALFRQPSLAIDAIDWRPVFSSLRWRHTEAHR